MILWNASLVGFYHCQRKSWLFCLFGVKHMETFSYKKSKLRTLRYEQQNLNLYTYSLPFINICDLKLIKVPLVPEINFLFAVANVGVASGQCHLVYLHICFSLEFTIISSSSLCCGSCNYNQVTFYQ